MSKEAHIEQSSAGARPKSRRTKSSSSGHGTGEKVSAAKELRERSIAFHFLNITHPAEAKEKTMRSQIQSHTAHVQHQREKMKRARNIPRASMEEAEGSSPRRLLPPAPEPSRTIKLPHRSLSATNETERTKESTGRSETQTDLLSEYPEEWRPWISQLMVLKSTASLIPIPLLIFLKEYYLNNVAAETPDLDGQNDQGFFRDSFFPFILTDPALLHSVMLLTASHRGSALGSSTQKIDILQLQGMAIQEINAALKDPERRASDQVIAAVAHMAYYEALFDDKENFKTHMTGVLRLVSLRGGLPALGLDGLLERMLLWIDANAAFITGSSIIFDETAFPSTVHHPKPEPGRFSGGLRTSPRV